MSPSKVLLVKAGEAASEVRKSAGDYDRWFQDAVDGAPVSFEIVRPYQGERLPPAERYRAVIVSGSPLSATEQAPWMRETAAWLRDAVEAGIPVLGVCFGHQLLGLAFGARVVRNPKGREMGTVRVRLTPEGEGDPLFSGLDREIAVEATHEDIVTDAPASLIPLAANESTDLQAFRGGKSGWGVQFHPELSESGLRTLAESRRAILDREGVARGLPDGEGSRRVLGSIGPTPHGRRILMNFLKQAGAIP